MLRTSPGSHTGAFGLVEWGLFTGVAVMWGLAYLFIAIGLESLPPPIITFLRIAIGAATLTLLPATRRVRIERRDWPRVVLLGVLWLALPLTLFPIAQQSITSAAAGMVTGAQPLFAAVIAALLLRRRPGRRQQQGIAVGLIGVVLIALPTASEGGTTSASGVLLVLVAVLSYALATNLAVPLQQRYGSLPVIWRALLVALVLVTPWALVSSGNVHASTASLLAMVPLGALSTGLGYVAFTTLAGRSGATRGAVAVYLVPVVAVIAGIVVRHDAVSPVALVGTASVLAGAWLTSRAER